MALAGADFCGWGAKQGSRVRSWKNRYFVLRGRELAYYGGAARDGRGVDKKGCVQVTGVEFAPDLKHGLLVRGVRKNQVLRMTTTDAAQSRALFRKIKEALGESQASFLPSASLRMDVNGSSGGNLNNSPPRKKSVPGLVPPRAASKSATGAVDVTREGWLLKEEPELQTWKRRYVTLSGNVLTYYASPTSMALESDVVQRVARDVANPRALHIVASGGRSIRLTGESRDDIAEWGAAISRAIGKPLPALLAARSWEDDGAGGFAGSERKIACHIEEESSSRRRRQYCEGWLEKRGYKSGAWKQRYFLLADGMLEYRKHPTGDVCAENMVVDVNYSGENPDWLLISFASDSAYDENSLCVRAPSADETRRWMLALCDLVGKPPLEPPGGQQQRSSSSESLLSSASLASASASPDVAVALSSSPAPFRISDVQNSTQRPSDQPHEANNRASVQVASSLVNQRASAANSPITNDTGNRTSQQGVIYRGWLLKKGQRFKTWKRRYFVLARTTLVYYRTSNVKGAILGSGIVFDVAVGKERPFSLDVRFRNGRQLHVVAPTQEIFSMWHHALRVSSDLTESFINSRPGGAGAGLDAVADEFDNDVEEAENSERDAEFTDADIAEYQSQLGTGAQLWVAAMKGMPLTERKYSWSSEADGKEPDPAMEPDASANSSAGDSVAGVSPDQALDSQPQGCQGWLMIEGNKLKSLQRRYCTLFGPKLSCYKSETSPLLQSLVVTAVTDWESVPFAIRVSGEGGAELIIAAQSNQDYQKWWRALYASAADKHERPTELKRTRSGDQRASSDGEIRSSTCSGWLEKEGRHFKTWKRRYFEFKNGALIYFSDVNGAVLGHGIVDHASVDSYKYNTLNIELRHGRTMRVTAADKSEMARWLGALNKSRTASSGTASLSDASEVHADDVPVIEEEAGRVSAPVAEKRLDSSDYLGNDTITDESYRRILSFEDNFSLIGTMNEAELSFRGELAFGERVKADDGSRVDKVEDACDDEEDPGDDIMDTTSGVEYYRALVDEEALAKERRLAADEARASEMPPIHGCTGACCVVM